MRFTVQFILPVDNPENNVRVVKRKKHFTFEVPVNHPRAHNMGFQELLEASELAKKLDLSTDLNKNTDSLTKPE